MPIAHSVFKQTVLNVRAHQLQQTRSKSVATDTIALSMNSWTNHSVSSTKWSFISALRWPALACVFDSVLAWYLTHGNPLAHPYGAFSVIFTSNCSLITGSLRKLYFSVQIVVIFKPSQILWRNLLRMWRESSSVKAINLVKKILQ